MKAEIPLKIIDLTVFSLIVAFSKCRLLLFLKKWGIKMRTLNTGPSAVASAAHAIPMFIGYIKT